MTKEVSPAQKAWSRPEVARLGKIRDVAGNITGVSNNGKNLNKT